MPQTATSSCLVASRVHSFIHFKWETSAGRGLCATDDRGTADTELEAKEGGPRDSVDTPLAFFSQHACDSGGAEPTYTVRKYCVVGTLYLQCRAIKD